MTGLREQVAVAKFLEDVIISEEEDSLYSYKSPWTDRSVAAHLGVSPQLVVGVRRAIYGSQFVQPDKIENGKPAINGGDAGVREALSELSKRVARLEMMIGGGDSSPTMTTNSSAARERIVPRFASRWDDDMAVSK